MQLFKNKFISSTFILILSGMATKILGLLIKIIYTRMMDPRSIGIISLIMPTYSLLINIASMSMPIVISKLIADKEDLSILNTASIIIISINIIIILFMYIFSPFIAENLLHVNETQYLLKACSLCLPFTSIACILKGYFYGIQKMYPHAISNTIEQVVRLLLIIFILPYFISKSYIEASCFLIITSFFTELSSIITFLICMNKKDRINLFKIKYNNNLSNKILKLSTPLVSTRIINNIAYFLEPIIVTSVLLTNLVPKDIIVQEYGAYNAYAIATLSIPSFFISAISSALLPELVKHKNNKQLFRKRIIQSLLFTFIIGFSFSIIITIFSDYLINMLYKTTLGSKYIKLLGPFFILFYFESILTTILQSKGNNKSILIITIISSISKIILTYSLCNIFKNIYGLVYSEIINIFIVIILNIIAIKNSKSN